MAWGRWCGIIFEVEHFEVLVVPVSAVDDMLVNGAPAPQRGAGAFTRSKSF